MWPKPTAHSKFIICKYPPSLLVKVTATRLDTTDRGSAISSLLQSFLPLLKCTRKKVFNAHLFVKLHVSKQTCTGTCFLYVTANDTLVLIKKKRTVHEPVHIQQFSIVMFVTFRHKKTWTILKSAKLSKNAMRSMRMTSQGKVFFSLFKCLGKSDYSKENLVCLQDRQVRVIWLLLALGKQKDQYLRVFLPRS